MTLSNEVKEVTDTERSEFITFFGLFFLSFLKLASLKIDDTQHSRIESSGRYQPGSSWSVWWCFVRWVVWKHLPGFQCRERGAWHQAEVRRAPLLTTRHLVLLRPQPLPRPGSQLCLAVDQTGLGLSAEPVNQNNRLKISPKMLLWAHFH